MSIFLIFLKSLKCKYDELYGIQPRDKRLAPPQLQYVGCIDFATPPPFPTLIEKNRCTFKLQRIFTNGVE